MLWMGDTQGRCVFLNAALRRFWGINSDRLDEFDWSSTLHPDDVNMLAGPFSQAMAAQTSFVVEARYRRSDGVFRTMRTEANPRFSKGGEFLGMTGVNTDISDQLAAEARNRLLMGELNHRTKNILTLVQALARQTALSEPTEYFQKVFDERLRALAANNDLLLRNDWEGVSLNDLLAAQLSHLPDLFGTRLTALGPPLRLPSHAAQTLGMAFHELSTNSLKYGALAVPEGNVAVTWESLPAGGYIIEWAEFSAGPIVEPRQKGFGHRVIVDMVESVLGAEVEIAFVPPGFRWRVRAPDLKTI
jgi:PAS domain S-box-containing protein